MRTDTANGLPAAIASAPERSAEAMRAAAESVLDEYRSLMARLERFDTDVATVTGTGRSADGAVIAMVGPHGALVDLRIDDDARRRLPSPALAATIVEAASRAADAARERLGTLVAAVLPEHLAGAIGPGGQVDLSLLLAADSPDLGVRLDRRW